MKILIGALIMIVISTVIFAASRFILYEPQTQSSTISKPTFSTSPLISLPYSAYFAVFTNGTFRLFNDPKYHHQSDYVYITNENVNKVTATIAGVTWQDFFNTLPMQLTNDCLTTGTAQKFCSNESSELKFILNGIQNQNALSEVIIPNSKLLISFGLKNKNVDNELEKLTEISR